VYAVGVLGGAILAHATYATIQCMLHPLLSPLPSPRSDQNSLWIFGFRGRSALISRVVLGRVPFGGLPVLWRPPRARIGHAVELWVDWGRGLDLVYYP
jgi:hypothetical protein